MCANNTKNQDSQIKTDPLKSFKKEVCQWLRESKLTVKWLASEIDRSEGTIRNWLYSSLTIPTKKQSDIRRVMDNYKSQHSSPSPGNDFRFIAIDCTESSQPPPAFECWESYLNVPSSFFTSPLPDRHIAPEWCSKDSRNRNSVHGVASQITSILTSAAITTLQAHYPGTVDDNDQKPVLNFFRDLRLEKEIEPLTKESSPMYTSETEDHQWLFLPILSEQWDGKQIKLAAAVEQKPILTWIIDTLNDFTCNFWKNFFDAIIAKGQKKSNP